MPMSGHDRNDNFGRIEAEVLHIDPLGLPALSMQESTNIPSPICITTLSPYPGPIRVSSISPRRRFRPCHSPNDRIVSRAHALPARRSASVSAERSRNTIWETRFLVPVAERS